MCEFQAKEEVSPLNVFALARKQQHANLLFEPPNKFVTEQLGMTYGRGRGQYWASNYLAVKET